MSSRKPSMAGATAPGAAVAAIAAAAALALGASGRAEAEPVRAHAPSLGIFSYSFPSALKIDVEHETVTLPP